MGGFGTDVKRWRTLTLLVWAVWLATAVGMSVDPRQRAASASALFLDGVPALFR